MNEEMSGDEVLVLVASVIVSVRGLVNWQSTLNASTTLTRARRSIAAFYLVPLFCVMVMLATLIGFSASNVKDDWRYITLFLTLGFAWLFAAGHAFSFLGMSLPMDAVQQANEAAKKALLGALIGVTAVYCGAQIGEGDTIWTTIIPAFIGTSVLLILWLAFELATDVSEAVILDHDSASAYQLAGLIIGNGIILGRAAAGDWHGLEPTIRDFVVLGSPVIPLTAVAAIIHRWSRPVRAQRIETERNVGLRLAALYVTYAVLYATIYTLWNHHQTS